MTDEEVSEILEKNPEPNRLKVSDLKLLLSRRIQGALEDEESEFFRACDEINKSRGDFDPRELRSEHVPWHRKDAWLLVSSEKEQHFRRVHVFDCGLYRAVVETGGSHGDIQAVRVQIGAFWPPEFQPAPIELL